MARRNEGLPPEHVVFRGTVEACSEGSLVLGEAWLEADGPRQERSAARPFRLVLEDGSAISVEAGEARLATPGRSHRGSWAELEGHPLASLFDPPGPHVRVRLHGTAVLDGDRVALAGVPSDHGFLDGGGGLREAPERVVRGVRALVVASGEDAEAQLEKALAAEFRPGRAGRRARPWQTRRAAALALALGTLSAVAILTTVSAGGSPLDTLSSLAIALLVSVMLARALWPAPRFRSLAPGRTTSDVLAEPSPPLEAAAICVAVPMLLVFEFFVVGTLLDSSLVLGLAALFALLFIHQDRRSFRVARSLLRAPPLGRSEGARVWCAVEGELGNPGAPPLWCRDHFYTRVTHDASGTKERRRTEDRAEREQQVPGDVVVVASEGRVAVVPSSSGLWASSIQERRRDDEGRFLWIEVPSGASVLVAGRRAEGSSSTLVATGPESLLLYATRPGRSARSELRGRLLVHRLALSLALASLVIAVAGVSRHW